MRDAGVGITVTSATNIIVFLIGGTTVLPSLRSYSIFTGVGIVFTFFLQLTFFLAWFTIDQRRIESQRDGMCCWRRHPHHQPTNKPGLLKKVAAVLASSLRHKVVAYVAHYATSLRDKGVVNLIETALPLMVKYNANVWELVAYPVMNLSMTESGSKSN